MENQSEKSIQCRIHGMEASYLASCTLHGVKPERSPGDDLEGLYQFCKFHSMTSIVAMALEEVWKENPGDPEEMKRWRQAKDRTIRKNILLNAERERILKYLESIGCWYMPLKGSLLQFDYPKFGMRQMSDNDILFDETQAEEVYKFMLGSGYEAVSYRTGNHDEYVKKPVYNMEMHRSLFQNGLDPVLAAYYRDVKSRMIKDAENSFGYHFSREDFYIYLVAHAYKHYLYGGIGIRNLLDVYVYVEKYGDNLDWDYIFRELVKMDAAAFEKECRHLADKLLGTPDRNPELTQDEKRALDIYFTSGTYGTEQKAVENRLQKDTAGKGSKLRYILYRMFPPLSYLAESEPGLEKQKWKVPFVYLKRLLKAIFASPGRILREIKLLKNTDK